MHRIKAGPFSGCMSRLKQSLLKQGHLRSQRMQNMWFEHDDGLKIMVAV